MAKSQSQPDKLYRTRLDFPENGNLGALFGEYDQNLVRIEEELGVVISSRGNRVAIEGDKVSCGIAKRALESLYRRLKAGEAIEGGDILGAIRMAGDEMNVSNTPSAESAVRISTPRRIINPRSPMQAQYMSALIADDLIFAIGPAGTGKTYLAVAAAVADLMAGKVERIILSRPAVEAGERLGFLPGDLREKVDPYLRPLYDALYALLPATQVERRLENGEIEIAPLAFMRGRTLSNAFIILDEAQNTTDMQMKMFLTRFGENSRMVVAGDVTQVDLPRGESSGLQDAMKLLDGIKGVSAIRFSEADVVRHPLVTRIVEAYERASAKGPGDGHSQNHD